MPINSGLPIWTGAPCTAGNRVVIWMARIASAGFSGRIDTTMGPWKGPAGIVAIEVRYIGTVTFKLMWRNSERLMSFETASRISACIPRSPVWNRVGFENRRDLGEFLRGVGAHLTMS